MKTILLGPQRFRTTVGTAIRTVAPDGPIATWSGGNGWFITTGAKNPDAATTEIMLDVPMGRIAYAVLSSGGFLGIDSFGWSNGSATARRASAATPSPTSWASASRRMTGWDMRTVPTATR